MKEFASIEEVLDFAINNEETAIDFYMNLAERIQDSTMRKAFLNFANEEKFLQYMLQVFDSNLLNKKIRLKRKVG